MWNNKRYFHERVISADLQSVVSTGNILISNILKLILELSDEYYEIYTVFTMMRD